MFLFSKGLSVLSSIRLPNPSDPSQVLQWTTSRAPETVRTLAKAWTKIPFADEDSNEDQIESMLKQCVTEIMDDDLAQFQLACVYWDMKESLEIQTDEPMQVLEHLKYIRASFNEYKQAKELAQRLEIQLKQGQSKCWELQQEKELIQQENEWLHQRLEVMCSTDASARKILQLEELLKASQCALNQEIEDNFALSKAMEDQIFDFERRISEANYQIESAKLSDVTLKAQLSAAIRDLETANANTLDLEQRMRGKSQKVTALKSKLSEAINQSSELHIALKESNTKCISLEEDVFVYSQQIVELNESLQETRESKEQLERKFEDINQCVVCLDNIKTSVSIIPCGHLFCETCVKELQERQIDICPVCRKDIESTLKIYIDK